jgi:hypothetical protein
MSFLALARGMIERIVSRDADGRQVGFLAVGLGHGFGVAPLAAARAA